MRYLITLLIAALSLNAFSQGIPQLPYNPDSNGDGFIGVSDLQDFLATYANEFIPENLLVSQGTAFYYLGILDYAHCYNQSENLIGNWKMLDERTLLENFKLLADTTTLLWNGNYSSPSRFLWFGPNDSFEEYSSNSTKKFLKIAYQEYYDDSYENNGWYDFGATHIGAEDSSTPDKFNCFCYLKERPKIEYTRATQDAPIEQINQLTSQGWYIQSTTQSYIHFWRWAE